MPNAASAFAAFPNSPARKALGNMRTHPNPAYGAATITVNVDISTARRGSVGSVCHRAAFSHEGRSYGLAPYLQRIVLWINCTHEPKSRCRVSFGLSITING